MCPQPPLAAAGQPAHDSGASAMHTGADPCTEVVDGKFESMSGMPTTMLERETTDEQGKLSTQVCIELLQTGRDGQL